LAFSGRTVRLYYLHRHVPSFALKTVLPKVKQALKPNGVLIILDLFQSEGLLNLLTDVVAFPASIILRLVYTGRLQEPREVREAWAEHGRHDTYLPLSEIRNICAILLPQAMIKKHFFWRYSLVWRKKE
jgi:hypothetical protein